MKEYLKAQNPKEILASIPAGVTGGIPVWSIESSNERAPARFSGWLPAEIPGHISAKTFNGIPRAINEKTFGGLLEEISVRRRNHFEWIFERISEGITIKNS